MKRIIAFSALALFACSITSAEGAPKILCDQPVYDFGDHDNDVDVKHGFTISNTGSGNLEIASVKTSCGCTVAELEDKSLAPGESTKVRATLSLKGKRGKQHKQIVVHSNDPQTPHYQLTMMGNAVAAIEILPAVANFGRIVNDDPQTRTVTVASARDDAKFKIAKIESTIDAFEVTAKTQPDGMSHIVSITAPGKMAPGNLAGQVKLHTDNPKHPLVTVNTYGQVLGPISYAPSTMIVPEQLNARAPTSRAIRLSPGRIQDFKVLKVTPPVDSISVEIIPQGSRGYLIQLNDLPPGSELAGKEIVVETDAAGMEKIVIPIHVPGAQATATP